MDSTFDAGPLSATVNKVREVSDITLALVVDISEEELKIATKLVKGYRIMEVPGKKDQATATAPKPLRPPDPRVLQDYITSPCKHECAIIKHRRHIKQAHKVLSSMHPVRSAVMRACAGQCCLE